MSKPKNIRIIRAIARRWAKGVLLYGGVQEAFVSLTPEEQEIAEDEVSRVCERITEDAAAMDVGQLIKEYFEP